MAFILFFIVFLIIYCFANGYIFLKFWRILPQSALIKWIYIISFFYISFSFIVGRIIERFDICTVSKFSIWVGSFWLAVMVYLFIGFILNDVFLSIIKIRFAGDPFISSYQRAAGLILPAIVILIVIAGHFNAITPDLKTLNISVEKESVLKKLNIVLVTDIHCGILIGNSRLEKMVKTINEISPDAVLLAGDIVDEDLKPVIAQNIGDTLKNIKSRFGVFAVTGNHEYIGGVNEAVTYLRNHGVNVLRDQCVLIGNLFYVAGREDRSIKRFNGQKRKSISEILQGINRKYPVVLMDHQPYNLDEASNNGVDLQVSGHTHHGQLWPFNFITRKVYELSWGYMKKYNTHYYVSSGFGTWGPPVRTGNRPEIVHIIIYLD